MSFLLRTCVESDFLCDPVVYDKGHSEVDNPSSRSRFGGGVERHDGGEFTTYHEFQALKDRCRILMLDDVNSDKCRLIRDELRSNPDRWTVLKTNAVRNGYLIAESKKSFHVA